MGIQCSEFDPLCFMFVLRTFWTKSYVKVVLGKTRVERRAIKDPERQGAIYFKRNMTNYARLLSHPHVIRCFITASFKPDKHIFRQWNVFPTRGVLPNDFVGFKEDNTFPINASVLAIWDYRLACGDLIKSSTKHAYKANKYTHIHMFKDGLMLKPGQQAVEINSQ